MTRFATARLTPLLGSLLGPLVALAPLSRVAAQAAGAPPPPTAPPAPPASAARRMQEVRPVLAFPEAGLDDTVAYRAYRTRFFRDAAGNTVQVYLDTRDGRVVHLWADAENESLGFTARDADGRPAAVEWGGDGATVGGATRGRGIRTLEHRLVAPGPELRLGWFTSGSMRVERDLQYSGGHRRPFGDAPYEVREIAALLAALERLDPATRGRHLGLLGARDVASLRARLRPRVSARTEGTSWVARIVQPALDGRDSLVMEVRADARAVTGSTAGDTVVALRARGAGPIPFAVRIATTGAPLTPLTRAEIFTPEFLAFLRRATPATESVANAPDALRRRRLERQVRGVELLASREKFMAGLPTYATYFGRDMMVSALMMRPIWRPAATEAVIGSVLRKLGPDGGVSHEEALGGQAVREAAGEYAALVAARDTAAQRGDRAAADTLLHRAERVLRERRRTRENYHMVDDEFQLPVLVARWLDDPAVSAERRRAFLLAPADPAGGSRETRLERLLRELALVARLTAPYAADPSPTNLVSFPAVDSTWGSRSWRDSGAGYGGGRFAMDVNAIWVPHALASTERILAALRALRLPVDSVAARRPELAGDAPLARWMRDPAALRAATAAWRGADRHFLVRLGRDEVRAGVEARLAALPEAERAYWRGRPTAGPAPDTLTFLALALDARGQPVRVLNTDPATRLFLDADGAAAASAGDTSRAAAPSLAAAVRDAAPFAEPYPLGLLVPGVGPVVANDAWASPAVWAAFERDRYHGPRVVWGREVNLFILGATAHLAAAERAGDAAAAQLLRAAVSRAREAVEASGFHSELWSYEVEGGRLVPMRYGTGADVQLWSTTDLAVAWALREQSRNPR